MIRKTKVALKSGLAPLQLFTATIREHQGPDLQFHFKVQISFQPRDTKYENLETEPRYQLSGDTGM